MLASTTQEPSFTSCWLSQHFSTIHKKFYLEWVSVKWIYVHHAFSCEAYNFLNCFCLPQLRAKELFPTEHIDAAVCLRLSYHLRLSSKNWTYTVTAGFTYKLFLWEALCGNLRLFWYNEAIFGPKLSSQEIYRDTVKLCKRNNNWQKLYPSVSLSLFLSLFSYPLPLAPQLGKANLNS